MSDPDEELPTIYALRFTARARADIEATHTRLMELQDEETADAWQAGLMEAVMPLARMPHRQVIVENKYFKRDVRQILYRRSSGSVAYRILFTIIEAKDDAPVVRILHVRHGSTRPVTRKEAQALENEE